ncbi:MAG TPA: sulfotransferase [Chitinophagaceae bacterium]|nr:sulfotransferase [Chitinophagaceae bacterium]
MKIDLMIIGAQKAGTTSLQNYLNEHPEILGHPQIEFGFFKDDAMYANGYEKEFSRHFTAGNINTAKAVVAKNTGMYDSEKALERLRQHNPDCKLVFIVREPVSRAYSSYSMEKFNGLLTRDFSEIKDVIEEKRFDDMMYRFFIRLGLYSEFLKSIYKFFPENQVKIVLFEKLGKDPAGVCREIFQWLNIDPSFTPSTEKEYNKTQKPKSVLVSNILMRLRSNDNVIKKVAKKVLPYKVFTRLGTFLIESNKSSKRTKPISPEIKEYLQQFFAPYNKELEELAKIDLNGWRK